MLRPLSLLAVLAAGCFSSARGVEPPAPLPSATPLPPMRLPAPATPPPSAGDFLTEGVEAVSEAEAAAKGATVAEAGFPVDVRADGTRGFLISEPKNARLNVVAAAGWRTDATESGLRLRRREGALPKGTLACTDERGTTVNYLKDGKGLMTVRLAPGRKLRLVLGNNRIATLSLAERR